MNPKASQTAWPRLTTAARTVPDTRDTAVPYGFATRVAALAMAQERKVASMFERLAFRALGAACLLALLSVVVNYSVINQTPTASEDELTEDDPVAVLLDT